MRPAIVVSSDAYHLARPDVVAAGISTQIAKVGPYDYVLTHWSSAGLRYPSLVRGRLLTIEQSLIRRSVGRLSAHDLAGVEEKLATFLLSDIAIADYLLTHTDPTMLPGRDVQLLAEKFIRTCLKLTARDTPMIDLDRLRRLLAPPTHP